jgi:very-short-patch-repair endonuclease
MAAVLNCGHDAALSHVSAGVHWKILSKRGGPIHVSVPTGRSVRRRGIKVYRRAGPFNVTRHHGIPITAAIDTLVDLATALGDDRLERGMNEAVNRGLTNPDALRTAVGAMPRRRGAHRIAMLLDRDTYVVTDTRLEQRLLRIVRGAGLPLPITQRHLGGGRVDFFWPRLGLIVEADSLRYHRTPAQQRADRLRDQKHAAAGLTTLRFTHWQIFFEPEHVRATLTAVIERLAA